MFGFDIFEDFKNECFRSQKFAGGLVETQKLRTEIEERKRFKIFGIPVLERIIKDESMTYKFFGLYVRKIYLPEVFYKKYLKNIKFDYDDVYILHAASGEAYLFFAYFAKEFLKRNNSKKPLFIASEKCHQDIIDMYIPNSRILYIENLLLKIKKSSWHFKGKNFYLIFSSDYYFNEAKEIYSNDINKIHYIDYTRKYLNLPVSALSKPEIMKAQNDDEKQLLYTKINSLSLDLDNFVILSPEARTCEELSVSLWKNLIHVLKSKGFDIYLNITDKENYIEGCKYAFLNYQEIFELAKKAKAVISLRSGLTEFLIPAEIPNITVYTKFRNRYKYSFSAEKTMYAFSMHKFPFVNNDLICELNIENYKNDDELSAAILKNFEKMTAGKAGVA